MTTTDDTGTAAQPTGDGTGDAVDTQVSGTNGAAVAPQGRSGKTVAVPLDGRVIRPTRVISAAALRAVIRDGEAAALSTVETRTQSGPPPQKAQLLSSTRLVDLVGSQPDDTSAPEDAPMPVKSKADPDDAGRVTSPANDDVAADRSRRNVSRGRRSEAGNRTRADDLAPDAREEEEVDVAQPREPKQRKSRPLRKRNPRSFSSDVPGSRYLPGFLDTPWRRFLLFWGTAAAAGSYAGIRVWFSTWANDPIHQVDGVLAYAITLVAFTIGVLIFRATKFSPFALFGLLVLAAWLGSTYGPDALPLVYPHTAKAGLSPYDTKLLANAIGLIGPMAWWMWLVRRKFWLWRWLACALLSSSILACAMFTTAS
ncbi:hypothetical protein OG413_40985 [Streptomyces sp. NBC_01433]|uniref:hypothetical protein n=1 Tax=Streptomyces sp. NBC_01433 TaxID=2903864 RepID=UPI0022581129|nr:hypothetical protein [Streptomyces sp. NBC_01433]MCX4681579.1 hypothetical protein [Streptomyces sp. NBC_01433]